MNPKGDSTKPNGNIILWKINKFGGDVNKSAYRWTLSFDYNNGFYTIKNNKSKLPMDVAGGSRKANANLQQYTANRSYAQQFQIISRNGSYEIRSRLGTSVDVAGGKLAKRQNIQLYIPNNSKAQRWYFGY